MSDIDHVNSEVMRAPKPLAKVWTKHVEARTIWEKLKDNLNKFQWDIFSEKVQHKKTVRILGGWGGQRQKQGLMIRCDTRCDLIRYQLSLHVDPPQHLPPPPPPTLQLSVADVRRERQMKEYLKIRDRAVAALMQRTIFDEDLEEAGEFDVAKELEMLRTLVRERIDDFVNVFDSHAKGDAAEHFERMSFREFFELLQDCKLMTVRESTATHKGRKAVLDKDKVIDIFMDVGAETDEGQEEPRLSDLEISPPKFVEALVRIALVLYKSTLPLTKRLVRLLDDDILPYAEVVHADSFRGNLRKPGVQRVVKQKTDRLQKVFNKYARKVSVARAGSFSGKPSSPGGNAGMKTRRILPWTGFRRMLDDYHIITRREQRNRRKARATAAQQADAEDDGLGGEDRKDKEPSSLFNEEKAKFLFQQCRADSAEAFAHEAEDTLQKAIKGKEKKKQLELQSGLFPIFYFEFVEAIAAMAHYKFKDPYLTTDKKIDLFVSQYLSDKSARMGVALRELSRAS